MPIIVNLSTIHDYSLDYFLEQTTNAFVELCIKYRDQAESPMFHKKWVETQLALHSKQIALYKLGKISTPDFLTILSNICYFMKDVPNKESQLVDAWNAGIKLRSDGEQRLLNLMEKAQTEPVYLISNTNQLNLLAVFALFKNITFNQMDLSIPPDADKTPVEVLPNLFLCASYRFQQFRQEGMLDYLYKTLEGSLTFVSAYPDDFNSVEKLNILTKTPEEFFENTISYQLNA